MELNIFAMAFTSAMLHPWREFFIKQNKNPEGACLAAMIVWTTLAALHAFIEGIDLFSIQLIWPITLASGLGFICFFIFALRTYSCLLYTSPSPRDRTRSRMPSSA